jgi:PIN domain nuclease of toxin-antitoxin system
LDGDERGLNQFLLDTHVLLWWLSGEGNLEPLIAGLKEDGSSLAVSVVSLWEMQIKSQLGKLEFGGATLANIVDQFPKRGMVGPVPFRHEHVLELDRLPSFHKDPFDRALVAQARVEGRIIVSHDDSVLRYPVRSLKV